MPARRQQARKFMVAGPAGFIERSKSLMNNQNVHNAFQQ